MKRGAVLVCFHLLASIAAGGAPAQRQQGSGIELRVKAQTVMLKGCGGYGAGVVVREDKEWIYVLTAYHVVYMTSGNSCQNGTVRFSSPTGATSAEVPFETTAGANQALDLAAIKIAKTRLGNFPLHFTFSLARDPTTLRRGDHLFMVGFANGQTLWFVPPEPFFFADVDDNLAFGPPSIAYPGMSGGPICNADGEIVGIVMEKGTELGNAEPITAALDVFNRWKIAKAQLFAERHFPIMKPHYTEIGADAAFPSFVGGLSEDGPGASFHVAHGITRLVDATFDTTILYAKRTSSEYVEGPQGLVSMPVVEARQILMPSGGLQVQPFSGVPRKAVHETLGGFYVGGGMGWNFVARSVQGVNISVNENVSSLMLTTEAGYRWPLPRRGWGLKLSYRVYQPVHSMGLDRASSFTLGLYTVFR